MTNTEREWIELLTDALKMTTGEDPLVCSKHAGALMTHIQRELGGTFMYIPKPSRNYPVAALRNAVAREESVRSICKRYKLDHRTLKRLLADDEHSSRSVAEAINEQ